MRLSTLCLTWAIGLTVACGGSDNSIPNNRASTDPARVAVKEAAERETTTRSGTDTAHSNAEVSDFVMKMAADGAAEVELGRLAAQRGVDKEVKRFGEDMANEHVRAGEDLKQIAGQLDIAITAQPDDEHRALIERLSKLSGKAFDNAYMDAMVNGHQEVLAALEQHGGERMRMTGGGGQTQSEQPTATSGTAARGQQVVSEWAAKTLPVVQAHLTRAQQVHERLAGATGAAKK
jgi:putative membrane protein